jgi:hypothetical protein
LGVATDVELVDRIFSLVGNGDKLVVGRPFRVTVTTWRIRKLSFGRVRQVRREDLLKPVDLSMKKNCHAFRRKRWKTIPVIKLTWNTPIIGKLLSAV